MFDSSTQVTVHQLTSGHEHTWTWTHKHRGERVSHDAGLQVSEIQLDRCCPTCHQLHLLSWVSLGVEWRVAPIPNLTDQTGGKCHVVPTNQHAGPTLISQWEGEHLHLLLDWTNEKQGGERVSGIPGSKMTKTHLFELTCDISGACMSWTLTSPVGESMKGH